jgi:hypothetical protein
MKYNGKDFGAGDHENLGSVTWSKTPESVERDYLLYSS